MLYMLALVAMMLFPILVLALMPYLQPATPGDNGPIGSRHDPRSVPPSTAGVRSRPTHPTLRRIDAARRTDAPRLASHPAADALETRARQVTDEYWSELAWLTGNVTPRAFDTVVDALGADTRRLGPVNVVRRHDG